MYGNILGLPLAENMWNKSIMYFITHMSLIADLDWK